VAARTFGSLLHDGITTAACIKGLRLVCAYALGQLLGEILGEAFGIGHGVPLGFLISNFALWASVSEAQSKRLRIVVDLIALCAAASFGSALLVMATPELARLGRFGPELGLVFGAFLTGYLKRFGVLGGGLGSQIYIGALLAFGYHLLEPDLLSLFIAAPAAAVAAILPRLLIGARHAIPITGPAPTRGALVMGLQAAVAALVVVALDATLHLVEPEWAITACTYVIAGTAAGTAIRARQRIVGTCVGVLLALAYLPLAEHLAPLAWIAAALAMVVYAMALVDHYDIACAAFAFTLIVTLAANGEHSLMLLASRAWETMLGGVLGLLSARYFFPLQPARES
jgi:Fusaric acid resistance protein-like